jgi:hypothetical protein
MAKIILNEEGSTPATPSTGYWALYTKAGGLYLLDDAGVEILLESADFASIAEVNTGTETAKSVSPDSLAGSVHGEKAVGIVVFDSGTAVATGDGTNGIPIPASLNGMNIVAILATVHTQGITGTTDVQIRRRRSGSNVDVLSTKITIGAEYYAADGVINGSNDDLATGDVLYVDVDAVHSGTAPNGLSVVITARLP